MFDATDRQLLAILQSNARISNAEIARQLEMAPSAILERIRKLETRGVISGYEGRIAPKAVGLGLTAFVFVRTDEAGGAKKAGELLCDIPGVQEVHHVAGDDCYLVKLRAQDTDHLALLLREHFGKIRGLRSTRTTIVLGTPKETAQLSLQHLEDSANEAGHAA